MSNREESGLRGPVKTCVEESIYPGANTSDGKHIPEQKSWYTSEYDADGHLTVTRIRNSDGSEWVTQHTYDASGHLLKTTLGTKGEQSREMNYSYDGQRRLLNITDSQTPDNPISFRYDERGRKTKVQVSRPADYRPNSVLAGSPFEVADMAPNVPGGGSTTTIYDEDDRPTEVQVRDATGKLVSRTMRTYDALGRVSEEKQILDNLEAMFPADAFDKMLEASGASREELSEQLHEQLMKLMGGQAGPFSVVYTYDAQGRVNQMRREIYNQVHVIETTYNEQGDKALEITQGRETGSGEEQSTPSPGLRPYSEIRYSYRYDGYGNWTEENVSYRFSPGGAYESSGVRRRTLTYY